MTHLSDAFANALSSDVGLSLDQIDGVLSTLDSLHLDLVMSDGCESRDETYVRLSEYHKAKWNRWVHHHGDDNDFRDLAHRLESEGEHLYGNDFAVIDDKDPASRFHRLILVFEDIEDCSQLGVEHLDMLMALEEAGKRLAQEWVNAGMPLTGRPPKKYAQDTIDGEATIELQGFVMGFMKPPFNSKMHLHMHIMSLPLYPSKRQNNDNVHVDNFLPIGNLIHKLIRTRDKRNIYKFPSATSQRDGERNKRSIWKKLVGQ